MLTAVGILLLSITLGELFLAGVRLLQAERPRDPAGHSTLESSWSTVRQMGARMREIGFR
jgi:hypothetical protein